MYINERGEKKIGVRVGASPPERIMRLVLTYSMKEFVFLTFLEKRGVREEKDVREELMFECTIYDATDWFTL